MARVPTDFNPCAADLAKPLVAQIRLRVSAARTEPFWRATWEAVEVRDARWAAWLGGGEVGACEEVAGGFAWAVELDPEVVGVRCYILLL